ncbi:MAG: alpha/beta hydrolase [Actinomycetaceae bacterium]|nr:alpha/beta hydrolase [Actinomycetaceae bacterium]
MTEIRIPTLRGKTLAGNFVDPVDSQGVAVLFVHGFLSDRHSHGWFDRYAKAYRGIGYATLQIDCSGCGASDDDVITLDNITDDVRSSSLWLKENGFKKQIIHAHGFGAQASLRAHPDHVDAMILVSPVCGARDIEWDKIFTDKQLSELEQFGHTQIPDDTSCERENFVVSKRTLSDMSLTTPQDLFDRVTQSLLFIFSERDEDFGLVEMLHEGLEYLDEETRDVHIKVLENSDLLMPPEEVPDTVEELVELGRSWLRTHHPLTVRGAAGGSVN